MLETNDYVFIFFWELCAFLNQAFFYEIQASYFFSMKAINSKIKMLSTYYVCIEWILKTIENFLHGFQKDKVSIFKHSILR